MFFLNPLHTNFFSRLYLLIFAGIFYFAWITPPAQKHQFSVIENDQGLSVYEKGHPVFHYQRKPKLAGEKYYFNNYLHPLYNLQGEILTEEFPADHFYHRGLYWAWHQVYIAGKKIGDGWTMENISLSVESVKSVINKNDVSIRTTVFWKSPAYEHEKPFMLEKAKFTVYRQMATARVIDVEIALQALVPGTFIGGSDDAKGYGGFCARIKQPANLVFTSGTGAVTPKELQVIAGPWMDFSADFDSLHHIQSGLTIICHPETPNYPAPWILRQSGSMQNIVYPGSQRIELAMEHPTILRYRLVIHNGNAGDINIPDLQADYEKNMLK